MDLPEFFSKNLRRYISAGDTIVIALSGGPDSVALLHMLCAIREEYRLKLYAAHFDHMFRGVQSSRDAAFARSLCRSKGIPFYSAKKDIKKIASAQKGGLEKTARVERYRFLIKCAAKAGAKKIALGHNLDDNAETVLMRLIYGAGSAGLSGISPVRTVMPDEFGLKHDGSFTLIRPLSGACKKEILDILKKNKIKYAVDKTNSENVYTRNRLRNLLIPHIRDNYNPQISGALASAGEILSAENDFVNASAVAAYASAVEQGKGSLKINVLKFTKMHPAVQRRVVIEALKRLFISLRKVSFETVEAVVSCAAGGLKAQLPEDFYCSRENGWLVISKVNKKTPNKPLKIAQINGAKIRYNNFIYTFKIMENTGRFDFNRADKAYIDLAAVKMPLFIRARKAGDRFMPYGMDREVRLKKFFNTAALDKAAPVIADREKIVWAAGGRIDERVKVKTSSLKILVIERIQA